MTNIQVGRRAFLSGALGTIAAVGLSARTNFSHTSQSTAAVSGTAAANVSEVPTLAELAATVPAMFTQASYTDQESGKVLPYNIFLPEGYSSTVTYPLVHYIADSSLVGQEVAAPLNQYGALIWAGAADQAKHPSIVVVPEYPEVILDDHSGFTTTEYVELTARFVNFLRSEYSVDTDRVYGTGQSMGCMTTMYLAAKYPDLFAAEMLVSGQWDITALQNLSEEKFVYIAAGGDANASGGQVEVEDMLGKAGVPFQRSTWDASWKPEELEAAAQQLLTPGSSANFATFAIGTVLTANPVSTMEHMASFEPAYRITALRDWLFEQRA
ncbi:MAG: esterase [Comamonadaceae bacterium]|nr:MAG: esterase [Comamonadaceae bacterium]